MTVRHQKNYRQTDRQTDRHTDRIEIEKEERVTITHKTKPRGGLGDVRGLSRGLCVYQWNGILFLPRVTRAHNSLSSTRQIMSLELETRKCITKINKDSRAWLEAMPRRNRYIHKHDNFLSRRRCTHNNHNSHQYRHHCIHNHKNHLCRQPFEQPSITHSDQNLHRLNGFQVIKGK